MADLEAYIVLLGVIVWIGVIARFIQLPTPLILVITGMLLSFVPDFPIIKLNPNIVLDFFLPLLIYQTSTYMSWPEIKAYKRPIALLSVGHTIFITILVAVTAHALIPDLTWPLAFVLGAVVAPPDDVAIAEVSEKIQIPQNLLTILKGEGLLNDATALIIFRMSLVAAVTHHFSFAKAVFDFFAIIVLETIYGLIIGHLLGQLRLRLHEPMLEMLLSIVTPFLAYLPAIKLGGSGVLATVVTGVVVGHYYLPRFTPGSRLLWTSVWDTVAFTLSSILFLLVGLNFDLILSAISFIPIKELALYGISIVLVVVIGRFIWVYPEAYLPRWLFPFIRKTDPYPPWQYSFIVSWAGMRGGVSLAAALAIPSYYLYVDGVDFRALAVFLVFCVIAATLLVQGLTLPWLLRKLGVEQIGLQEKHNEKLNELSAKEAIMSKVLVLLRDYAMTVKNSPVLLQEVNSLIQEYENYLQGINEDIKNNNNVNYLNSEFNHVATAEVQNYVIDAEKQTLMQLWQEGKINIRIRNKLLQQLDYRARRFSEK